MATGYTSIIHDNENVTFRDYILRCARAFGACIMQREDGMAEPPKHRIPTPYYAEQLPEAQAELRRAEAMSDAVAGCAAEEEYQNELEYRQEAIARRTALRNRY